VTAGPRSPERHGGRSPGRSFRPGLLLAAALLPAGLAAQGIPVTVGVGAIESGAGAFDLPVTVDMSGRTELLGSFVITLRWNPAVLQSGGGVSGAFGDLTVNEDSAADGVLRLTGVNPGGMGGLITLAVGRFTVLVDDTTTFRVSVQELYAAGTFADLSADAVAIDRLYCGASAGRWGDVNGDGAVNGADALIVLTESVGLDVSQFATGFGDVDESGVRNPRDALIILSFAVGIPTVPFRVGQSAGGAVCSPPGALSYAVNPAAAEALVGQEVSYFAFGLDSAGAALALRNVTWTSSNPAVAGVDGAGLAATVGAGTTTITALQNDTVIATGTLTVAAARRTHWVDALAAGARNRLGSSGHPWASLEEAVPLTAAGDTIRLRPGRHAGATLDRRLTLVGDTAGGRPLPRLVSANVAGTLDTVLVLASAGRVELRDLLVDTAYIGVLALATDTVLLRGVEVRGAASGLAGVRAESARLLHVARSRIIGTPSTDYYYYYAADGVAASNSDRLVIDTSTVSDFTSDGLYAIGVDTIVVRGSILRRNAGAGLSITALDSASAARLTFSRNRVEQNPNGGVAGSYVAEARFDHNVFVGGGYSQDGVTLTGHRATIVAFQADTFDIRQGGWLYLSTFDSLMIDSVQVAQTEYYGAQAYGGRVGVLRNSVFRDVWDQAVYFGGRGPDTSSLVVRNVEFTGRTASSDYYYDGSGVELYEAALDLEDGRFSGLYYGVYGSQSAFRVRRASFTDNGYPLYGNCLEGASAIDSVTIRRSGYGVAYLYGCGSGVPPALVVDSMDVVDAQEGLYAYGAARAEVHRSRFLNVRDGLSVTADTVVVDGADVDVYDGSGIYLQADSLGSVTNSTAACAGDAGGIEIHGPAGWTVQGNAAAGPCDFGLTLFDSRDLVARGNAVNGSGDYGIWSRQTIAGRHRLVGNSVTGPFGYGSVRLDGVTNIRSATVFDSNVVSSGAEAGVYSDQADTLLIRDNMVSGIAPGTCCLSYEGGVVVTGQAPAGGGIVDIRRNRLTGNVRGVVLARAIQDSLTTVTVDSNRIVGSDTTAIFLTGYSGLLARYNLIDSSRAIGVFVDRFAAGAADDTLRVILSSNNITRNGAYGVFNQDGTGAQLGLLDARNNWWGDPAGPRGLYGNEVSVTGDSVSQGVYWSPALSAPVGVVPPAPPFAMLLAAPAPPMAGGTGRRPPRPGFTVRPASSLPTPSAPRTRAPGDAWASLLVTADQARAAQSALRVERLRQREANRGAAEARRAEQERAAVARRVRPAGEERP